MELSDIDKANFTFITFRAHVSEPQVFEDFINIFLPYISLKFPFYIYSIEDDDTPSRHIHLLLQHDQKDKQKLKQKIEAKYFKDFLKSLKSKETALAHALKYGKGPDGEDFGFTMKIEDKMKCIGYIYKDITRRNRTEGISQDCITQCCDFYYANRRIKNSSDNDWKIITSKNFHIKLEQYATENDKTVHDYDLVARMTHDKHSFQISAKDQEKYICELRFANKEYDTKNEEFYEINKFQEKTKLTEEDKYISYLQSKLKSAQVDYMGYFDNWESTKTTFQKQTM